MRKIAVCDVDLACRWPDFFFDIVCVANCFCCVCVCVVLGMDSSNSARRRNDHWNHNFASAIILQSQRQFSSNWVPEFGGTKIVLLFRMIGWVRLA